MPRFAIITSVLGALTLINCRGVRLGVTVSNATAVAKLVGLGLLCAVGAIYISAHSTVAPPIQPARHNEWLQAILLLFFAYGGYEIALIAAGEAREPQRHGPFALFAGLLTVTLLYTLLQAIVVRFVPDPAHSSRPLADAARVLMGQPGAVLISAAAILSVTGFLGANLLAMPRSVLAMATSGDLPARLAAIHAQHHTPCVSICVFSLMTWIAALFGSFTWNVTLSAVARLLYFAAVCAAVPALRRKQPRAAIFRVPGGALLPLTGIALCGVLLTRINLANFLVLGVTAGVALLNWLLLPRSSQNITASIPD